MNIKKECEELYEVIKKSQERLDEIRKICKHTNTEKTNYSYRVGQSSIEDVCQDCGQVIPSYIIN